jgi:UDP-glucose 4-epimerase
VNSDLETFFRGRRALITGGLGFIGSNLARRLVELGAEVSLVDALVPESGANRFNLDGIQSQVHLTVGDVRDQVLMSALLPGQDCLFNLAAQSSHLASMTDPHTDLEINATSQLALIEFCRKKVPAIKIVYASTRQIYGRPKYLPVDENHPLGPVDYNGISKMAGGLYYMVAHSVYGLRTTNLRMTNVYGPRMRIKDDRQTFVGWWFRQLLNGDELQVFGNGEQIRDFNDVDDVVEALLLSAADPAADGQIYNLGGGEPVSLLALAKLMVQINGGGMYHLVPFPKERKRIDIGDYYGDYSKIQNHLGWQPKTHLADGLARALAFYRQYKDRYW